MVRSTVVRSSVVRNSVRRAAALAATGALAVLATAGPALAASSPSGGTAPRAGVAAVQDNMPKPAEENMPPCHHHGLLGGLLEGLGDLLSALL